MLYKKDQVVYEIKYYGQSVSEKEDYDETKWDKLYIR